MIQKCIKLIPNYYREEEQRRVKELKDYLVEHNIVILDTTDAVMVT